MNICILTIDTDPKAGSGRFANELAGGLRAIGHDVTIAAYSSPLHFLRVVRAHARTCDIVLAIDLNPVGYWGFLATRGTRAKFVVTAQGTYAIAPLYSRKLGFLSTAVYRAADAVVAISSFTRSEILKKVPDLRITVITQGANELTQKPPTAKTRGRYIMGVGALKERKGYDVSIRAFARIHSEFPDLRYLIVGSWKEDPDRIGMLRQFAEELGAHGSVEFLGQIPNEELASLYDGAELFILTSVNDGHHVEGFGLVFLEAGLRGLASIGTMGNGIEDAVESGKTGLLVPQHDVVATADALRRLLDDPGLRARMGEVARQRATSRSWSDVARDYERLYRELLR